MWQDVRNAWRGIRRAPWMTLALVLSLGVGIGANTTVFSWVEAVLLRPVPGAAEPARLFVLSLERRDGRRQSWSLPNLQDLDTALTSAEIIGQDDLALNVAIGGRAERAYGALVTSDYFDALGVAPAVGRLFASDAGLTPRPVAVLSHAFWTRRFGGDPAVVGTRATINGVPVTVIGVAAPGFTGSLLGIATEAWMPVAMQPQLTGTDRLGRRASGWMQAWARLRPGVSRVEAQAEIDARMADLAVAYPEANATLRARLVRPWEADFGAPTVLAPILVVLAAVMVLVLALACANVTNLLLARAIDRRAEMAVRLSLGASRTRLVRQLLIESLLVALLAGVAGVLLAAWGHTLLLAFLPPVDVPVDLGLRIDGMTLAYAAAVSLAATMGFGVLPALHASATRPSAALQDAAGRAIGGGRRVRRVRGLLVAVQVGASALLLVSAALFARSLASAPDIDPGFDIERRAVSTVEPGASGYSVPAGRALYARIREGVTALPGVEGAALTRLLPLGFSGANQREVTIDGYTPRPDEALLVDYTSVSPGYFDVLGVPLRGRDFDAGDIDGREPVVIVSDTMARRYWPEGTALGGRIRIGDVAHRVIGIAGDVAEYRVDQVPDAFMYLPLGQAYASTASIVVRTTGEPGAALAGIRRVVGTLDPDLPVFGGRTMAEHAAAALFPQRIGASLLLVMSAMAVLLAVLGLYGVVAYALGRRRREMGIRLALGATPGAVRWLAARQGLGMAALGLLWGVAGAYGLARLLAGLLPGVGPSDPVAFVGVPLLLGLVVAVAAWVPARRAAVTDPAAALRSS